MLAEILKTNPVEHLGFKVTLKNLSITIDKFSFKGVVDKVENLSPTDLSLVLKSGSQTWTFKCDKHENQLTFGGDLCTKDLDLDVLFTLCFNNIQYPWLEMRLEMTQLEEVTQWSSYFSGHEKLLPNVNLGRLAKHILNSAEIIYAVKPTNKFNIFCERVKSIDFVVRMAQLRRHGHFPAIIKEEDGVVLASRLVSAWNVLLIQDAGQRLLVFQGVSSCDAVFIPGMNTLIIVCHITQQQILQCLRELGRTPEFFQIVRPRKFLGYLVGHSRPYHCNYDSLLALQHIREEGELLPEDALYSKNDEAFIDLGSGLGLKQKHQCKSKGSINNMTEAESGYLLKLGSWFWCFQKPDARSLEHANNVDQSLRQFANTNSIIANSGALDFMEECQPLLWVGITGQKRYWLEQIEGTVNILNTLYEHYPKIGVIFDGWTPPLSSSNYHRSEARKDSDIINKIIKNLTFRNHGRFGIIAGQPMLEKIRVGMSVDLFMANYTTGSVNVARICQKPGVGHMSRKMANHKSQHIHHYTREIDMLLVQDQDDSQALAGYINYSLPWQAIYNQLINILDDLDIKSSIPIEPLAIPVQP
ncbi:hypothetical protein BL107_05769 [Synechococcus sp. BL107]|uniref:hypothetical protein n=1 Tax=Synechococcus sp. BL107 TaxID=313625 RepID=UPI0000E53BF2|nr:hypothetical protein [Synechococcus sp. BL107]EAU71013.1 hypothetical protein BL107_05769 [Synechococcus sp. BL107]